jgi:hypothetical protein
LKRINKYIHLFKPINTTKPLIICLSYCFEIITIRLRSRECHICYSYSGFTFLMIMMLQFEGCIRILQVNGPKYAAKVIFMSLDVVLKCLALAISSFIFLISLHHFFRLQDYMSGLCYEGYLHIQVSFYYFLVYFVAFGFFVLFFRLCQIQYYQL